MGLTDRLISAFTRRTDTRELVDAQPTRQARLLDGITRRVDSLFNALTGLGGVGDKGAAARPDLLRTPMTIAELDALWRFNGYARRYVSLWPNAATRKGWRVVDDTQAVDLMESEDQRLNVLEQVNQAATWARKDGGALVLLITTEQIPAAYRDREDQWLEQPLDLNRVISVDNLVVLERSEASVWSYDADPRSPNYRRPLIWQVSPVSPVGGDALWDRRVHYSRVIYFPGNRLPPALRVATGDGYDESVIEAVWDQIRGLTSADQAAYTMAQDVRQDVLKIAGLASLETGDQAKLFDLRMQALAKSKGLLNMILLDETDQFETRTASVTGWKDLKDHAREAVAGVEAVPQTILFGEAPGGLNTDGESGFRAFGEEITAYQELDLKPRLRDLYLVLFRAKQGPTRGKEPEWWDVVFNPLDELPIPTRVEAELKQVQADALRVEALGVSPRHVIKSRYGDKGYQWDLLPVEGIEDVDTSYAASEADRLAVEADERDRQAQAAKQTPQGQLEEQAEPPEDQDRGDQDDTTARVFLYVPLSGQALARWTEARAAVADLLGDSFEPERLPHVTILALGEVQASQLQAIAGAARDAVADVHTWTSRAGPVGVFADAPGEGLPVALAFEWSGVFEQLNDVLLRRLAHQVTAPQFDRFVPHATLGYLRRGLTVDEQARLLELGQRPQDLDGLGWTPTQVRMAVDGIDVAAFPLSARLDGDDGTT